MSDMCHQCSYTSCIASDTERKRRLVALEVSMFLDIETSVGYPDGGVVQEDIFSRVPALFLITLGNYVVPCAPISYLSPRVRLTYALSG